MKVSVAIGIYNGADVVRQTLDAVLAQTHPAEEILVMDDGSTDSTLEVLKTYQPRITLMTQKNQGIASARNLLTRKSRGQVVAFLDHDDIWHPTYLENVAKQYAKFPQANAFYTAHVDFEGKGLYQWNTAKLSLDGDAELMSPLTFLHAYNTQTGRFGSASFCCVPKRTLEQMGPEPFRYSAVEDSYLATVLPLVGGPVVYCPTPRVAYRISPNSLSANRLKSLGLWVQVFESLQERYRTQPDPELRKGFVSAYAGKRRRFGKLLMGAGRRTEARQQFIQALRLPDSTASRIKSAGLLGLASLPAPLQPKWPGTDRLEGDKILSFSLPR